MNRIKTLCKKLTILIAVLAVGRMMSSLESVADASNWPQFRGENSQGISTETGLPTEWSETKNVLWKTNLPGKGSSSPVIWGNRLFLTSFTGYGFSKEAPGEMANLVRHLFCVDCNSGRILWKKDVPKRGKVQPFKNFVAYYHGYATHTPVTDGKAVYCWFANDGAFAFDLDGRLLWKNVPEGLGSLASYGTAASPVLFGDLVIINASIEGDVVIALDKNTGREVWRREKIASYTTPVIARTANGPEMVLNRHGKFAAYDPRTGDELWHHRHKADSYLITTPCLHEGIFYANNGAVGVIAVKAGGRGDVTSTHHVWDSQLVTDIPSTVYANGCLYTYKKSILHCVRARDGESLFKARIYGLRNVFASPMAADGKIYIIGRNGRSRVAKADTKFELLAENTIANDDSAFNASPAVSNGKLFIRSQKKLYCITTGDANNAK